MKDNKMVSVAANKADQWKCIQAFLQEAGCVLDYLHDRVVAEKLGGEVKRSPLFEQLKDADGALTEKLVIQYLAAMARQAKAGFVAGPDFPVFAPLPERKVSKAKKVVMGMQCLLAAAFIALGCCAAKIAQNENRLQRLKAWLPFAMSDRAGK